MTILGCLGISEFWTISDWTELGLVETQFVWFSVSCHKLCMSFHFCCMTCLWVLCAWEPLWSVLQFCEELCMHWQLDLDWVCSLPQVCAIIFWAETLEFGRSHITYQDVRHASWGSIECDLCRKCNSSIKVWVTHLRMNKGEFVLGMAWNGWDMVCMVIRGIVKLNCRLCPSCIWGPGLSQWVHQALSRRLEQFMAANVAASAVPAAPAAPSTEGVEFPVSENPALPAPALPAQTEWLRRILRKRKIRILSMWMEKTRKIRKKEMLEEMMTDRDPRGWEGIMSPSIPMRQPTCWVLPQAWLWESRPWSLRWKGRQTSLRSWLRVPILCSLTFADPWKPLEKPSPTWHVHPSPLLRGWITTPAGLEQW